MGKFINPFTDFGFKHIFGREMDKDILIEFLNDLLEGEHTIKDLRIMNNERLPETEQGRKVIFDIHCETDKGERIIIEMQNREQPHFKDRALYYLSHSVVEQGIKGTWDYELAAVYGVFFLNFTLDEKNRPNNNRNEGKFRRDIVLADRETGQVFNPKFRQIYIELPRFNKEEEECETDFERWIYVLKHMDTLDRMPFKARKATTGVQVTDYITHVILRHSNLNLHDRLKKYRCCLLHSFLECHGTGNVECHFRGVDFMVRTIIYVSMNTQYRESAKDTSLCCFLNTFTYCRDVFLRNSTTNYGRFK